MSESCSLEAADKFTILPHLQVGKKLPTKYGIEGDLRQALYKWVLGGGSWEGRERRDAVQVGGESGAWCGGGDVRCAAR